MFTDSDTKTGGERRRHPRTPVEWPITIALADGTYEARLRDVSAAGVCFFLDRPVPEMTVLELQFDLPDGSASMQCRGAVVRCEKISPQIDHFEVAVFLHDIAESDREALGAYVATREPSA